MKNIKRTISFALAFLTIAGMFACKKASSYPDSETSDNKTSGVSDSETSPETKYEDTLPEKSYYGADFKMLISEQLADLTFTEADLGNQVDNAIYTSYARVIDRFNLKFSVKAMSTQSKGATAFANEVRTTVSSGDTYDLVMGQLYFCLPLAYDGIWADLSDAEYLNTDQPWYYQSINDKLELCDQMYAITGAFNMDKLSASMITYYNKDMFKSLVSGNEKYQNIYETVKNGEWTFDDMNTLVALAQSENGDGMWDESDTYGFVGTGTQFTCLISSDLPGFEKNGNGEWELVFWSERLVDVFNTYKGFLSQPYVRNGGYDDTDIFTSGNSLFYSSHLSQMATVKDSSQFEVGVLPFPKYDTKQENYLTFVNRSEAYYIPSVVDFEKSTLVLDYLNYLFYENVVPAYWETTMKSRYNDDPNDWEMLDLIRSSTYDDFGYIFRSELGSFYDKCAPLLLTDTELSAWWATKKLEVETSFNSLMEKYEKMAENLGK